MEQNNNSSQKVFERIIYIMHARFSNILTYNSIY